MLKIARENVSLAKRNVSISLTLSLSQCTHFSCEMEFLSGYFLPGRIQEVNE
jgi:hypothetical protein